MSAFDSGFDSSSFSSSFWIDDLTACLTSTCMESIYINCCNCCTTPMSISSRTTNDVNLESYENGALTFKIPPIKRRKIILYRSKTQRQDYQN